MSKHFDVGCPHCGGGGGHQYIMRVRMVMANGWGQEPECQDTGDASPKPKTVRCVDCGRRVKYELAAKP